MFIRIDRVLRHLLMLILLVVLTAGSAKCGSQKPGEAKRATSDSNHHYLLLVNTAIAQFMNEDKLSQFDKSYYDGIAIAFLHAYETSTVPTVADMDRQMKIWKKATSKDIWPWVYVNRMIGSNLAEKNHYADNPYFNAIKGADLGDSKGALSDFFAIWANSLAAARDSNAPGVVFDLEFYNNYSEYDIGEMAAKTGKTVPEVARSLERIGARMVDSAAQVYPNATLWLLFTALTHPGYKKIDGVSYYPSPAYFSIGMLDEIVAKNLPLKVLAGGEGSIGYCHQSLAEFQKAIAERQTQLANDLRKYGGFLELGGTLAVWSDRKAKREWLTEGACNGSDADTIEDLKAYIELLLKSYRYNWLYATSQGNYDPFSKASAPRFDEVIRKAREATSQDTRTVQH